MNRTTRFVLRGGLAGLLANLASSPALAQAANPQGSGPIIAAMSWMQGTLLGNVATTVAVIAVAMVGFMMLTGRLNWRMGGTVVLAASSSSAPLSSSAASSC